MNRLLTSSGVMLAVAVAAVGCGNAKKASTPATSTGSTSAATATTISSRTSPVGAVLVDSSGRTLYMFESDKGGKSACSGACASAWPPVIAGGAPTAGSGVSQAKLTTIARSDGSRQVSYNGHPLYRFSGDGSAGVFKGQNAHAFGGDWYVLSPSGEEIDRAIPTTSSGSSGGASGSSGGSGSSYGY